MPTNEPFAVKPSRVEELLMQIRDAVEQGGGGGGGDATLAARVTELENWVTDNEALDSAQSTAIDENVTDISDIKERLDASDETKSDFLCFGYYTITAFTETANAVSKNTNPRTVLTDGYSGFQTATIAVSEGERYRISGWGSVDTLFNPAFYGDTDSKIVEILDVTLSTGYFTNEEITVPYAATRLCINGRSTTGHPIVVEKLENFEKSEEFFETYNTVKASALSALQFPSWHTEEITIVDNKLCNYKTLAVSDSSGFDYLIYSVSAGEKYRITGWGSASGDYAPAFWSASALINVIPVTTDGNGYYEEFEVIVPEGATRIVLNGRPNRGYNIKIDKSEADQKSEAFWAEYSEVKETVKNATYQPLAGKVIVNFGDSIFGNYSAPNDISSEIAKITGATVYNCGFSGCRMAAHVYSGWDAFSMYRLAYSVANNDFTVQDNAIANPNWPDKPAKFATTLALLESIDFSEVDYITIAYGTNDFTGNVAIDDQNNELNTKTYKGALRYTLNQLLAAHPHIKVITCTPIYRTWNDDGGQYENDANTRLNENDNTLRDFYDSVLDVTDKYNVQAIDNFHIGMSRYNRTYYWTSPDFTHPNIKGRKLIAEHISHELY